MIVYNPLNTNVNFLLSVMFKFYKSEEKRSLRKANKASLKPSLLYQFLYSPVVPRNVKKMNERDSLSTSLTPLPSQKTLLILYLISLFLGLQQNTKSLSFSKKKKKQIAMKSSLIVWLFKRCV